MATVCRKCGVTGFSELLVYCKDCFLSAEHRYCLNKAPEGDEIIWSCEECVPTIEPLSISEHSDSRSHGDTTILAENVHVEDEVIQPVQAKNECFIRPEENNSKSCSEDDEGDQKLKKRRRKLILEDEECFDEEKVESAEDVYNAPINILHPPFVEYHIDSQPIIDPIWRGRLEIFNENYGTAVRLAAHLASTACLKVSEEANALPSLLRVELLSRSCVWPKSFCTSLPTGDNIALYFFPENERDEEIFDGFLDDMIDRDLALKAVVDNAELLVFSSLQLPRQYWRFQKKFYMWGVFRGKQVVRTHKAGDQLIEKGISESAVPSIGLEGRDPIEIQNRSPLGPLSTNSSFGSELSHSPLHHKPVIFSSKSVSSHVSKLVTEKSGDHEEEPKKKCRYEEAKERIDDWDPNLSNNEELPQHYYDMESSEESLSRKCLELFPLEGEDMAILTKIRSVEVNFDLGLGRSVTEERDRVDHLCIRSQKDTTVFL